MELLRVVFGVCIMMDVCCPSSSRRAGLCACLFLHSTPISVWRVFFVFCRLDCERTLGAGGKASYYGRMYTSHFANQQRQQQQAGTNSNDTVAAAAPADTIPAMLLTATEINPGWAALQQQHQESGWQAQPNLVGWPPSLGSAQHGVGLAAINGASSTAAGIALDSSSSSGSALASHAVISNSALLLPRHDGIAPRQPPQPPPATSASLYSAGRVTESLVTPPAADAAAAAAAAGGAEAGALVFAAPAAAAGISNSTSSALSQGSPGTASAVLVGGSTTPPPPAGKSPGGSSPSVGTTSPGGTAAAAAAARTTPTKKKPRGPRKKKPKLASPAAPLGGAEGPVRRRRVVKVKRERAEEVPLGEKGRESAMNIVRLLAGSPLSEEFRKPVVQLHPEVSHSMC